MAIFIFPEITSPTAIVNVDRAKLNIQKMAAKAAAQHVRFRPHFKTHQSAGIGKWFRQVGVKSITVSSVGMAEYFARHGWEDILIAFPVNPREIAKINVLAQQVNLSLLVESVEIVQFLEESLTSIVNVWIKIDTGMHRTGISFDHQVEIISLCEKILASRKLRLAGLLTHAGQTYHARIKDDIPGMYSESVQRMLDLRHQIADRLETELSISVGDTPGCWLSPTLGNVDEIRPGNFIFFDAMMLDLGVCDPEDIALAVVCPVVAKHPERNEVVLYGGAVHLSKDFLYKENNVFYGYAAIINPDGWKFHGKENLVLSLSQEHGLVRLRDSLYEKIRIGDLMAVIPVHSCLAVDALGELMDLNGNRYTTMRQR